MEAHGALEARVSIWTIWCFLMQLYSQSLQVNAQTSRLRMKTCRGILCGVSKIAALVWCQV